MVLDILAGRVEVESLTHAWELLRSPLPRMESTSEPRARRLFSAIRQDLGFAERRSGKPTVRLPI